MNFPYWENTDKPKTMQHAEKQITKVFWSDFWHRANQN